MTGTREQILSALFAIVSTIPSAVQFSRRVAQAPNVPPDMQPAVYQVEYDEEVRRKGTGTPPTRFLLPQIWLYAQSGSLTQGDPTSQGATAINNFLDQLEAALKPDNLIRDVLTLGGLCYWCRYEGRTLKNAGNFGTQAAAIARLRICMP